MKSRYTGLGRVDRGFTILEAVISLGLFLMATLMFATVAPVASRASTVNGEYAQAVSFCQHKVDQCRQIGYGRLTYSELKSAGLIDASPSSAPFSFTGVDTLTGSRLANVTGTLNVQDITPIVSGVLARQITVTITWTTGTFRNRTNTVTLVAQIMQSE